MRYIIGNSLLVRNKWIMWMHSFSCKLKMKANIVTLTHIFKFFLIWQRKARHFGNVHFYHAENVSHLLKASFMSIVAKSGKALWSRKVFNILFSELYSFIRLRHQKKTIRMALVFLGENICTGSVNPFTFIWDNKIAVVLQCTLILDWALFYGSIPFLCWFISYNSLFCYFSGL